MHVVPRTSREAPSAETCAGFEEAPAGGAWSHDTQDEEQVSARSLDEAFDGAESRRQLRPRSAAATLIAAKLPRSAARRRRCMAGREGEIDSGQRAASVRDMVEKLKAREPEKPWASAGPRDPAQGER